MRVVLDTSVLVAAWRSREGASFELIRLVRASQLEIAVSVPLVVEYEGALLRHLLPPLEARDVDIFLDYLCGVAHLQEIFFLWRPLLRDPCEDMVAEVAFASGADAIVTHNTRDFALAADLGLAVVTPGSLLSQRPWR